MIDKSKIWLSSPHMSGNEMKYIHEAFDGNWKLLVGPGENVIMFFDIDKDVKIGDKVVISNEELCTLRNKTSLKCDIILCNI